MSADAKAAAARQLVQVKRSHGWDYLLWADLGWYSDSQVIQAVESAGWRWGANFQRWFYQLDFDKQKASVAQMLTEKE